MTLQELISKYTGQPCEVAGSANAKNQCVDLANAKIRDVDGNPIIEWTNAVDFPERGSQYYDFIPNSKEGVPPIGSLAVFGKYAKLYGVEGHIGVVVYADLKNIKLFEQNFPTGSLCKIGDHNYLGCRGWMVPKARVTGYSSVFEKYGYPATLPTEALEIIFSKYHEWRDKLQLGELLTKDEYTLKLREATEALQRYEVYRKQVSKILFNVEEAGWDKILESIPKTIQEADSNKIPAKAAHELFTQVNTHFHNVYVYPEDISTSLTAFYELFLKYKSQIETTEAQKVADDKEEVINVTPEQAKSLFETLFNIWRSIWQPKSST